MKAKAYRLLVVAHPDDETIFFGGLVQRLKSLPWRLVCVTNGNADGRGMERHQELLAAAKKLGIKKVDHWDYADIFSERLPVDRIRAQLSLLPIPSEIYTHGPLGEYGHPHHQDVCLAVHRAFASKKITSPAWNCIAEKVIALTPTEYKKKSTAYRDIYPKEIERFLNILPSSGTESFSRFTFNEVEALVGYFRKEKALNAKSLRLYAWMAPLLPALRERLAKRLF